MTKTVDLLDALKARHNLTSDYQLAKFLGVKQSTISNYRTGRTCLDDEMALRVADALSVNPLYVIAVAHAERADRQANEQVQSLWEAIAKKAAGAAVSVLLGFGLSLHSPDGTASAGERAPSGFGAMYIMLSRWLALWARRSTLRAMP